MVWMTYERRVSSICYIKFSPAASYQIWRMMKNASDINMVLTHKQSEMHECMRNTVVTDGLVLKHQAISTHSADQICIALG